MRDQNIFSHTDNTYQLLYTTLPLMDKSINSRSAPRAPTRTGSKRKLKKTSPKHDDTSNNGLWSNLALSTLPNIKSNDEMNASLQSGNGLLSWNNKNPLSNFTMSFLQPRSHKPLVNKKPAKNDRTTTGLSRGQSSKLITQSVMKPPNKNIQPAEIFRTPKRANHGGMNAPSNNESTDFVLVSTRPDDHGNESFIQNEVLPEVIMFYDPLKASSKWPFKKIARTDLYEGSGGRVVFAIRKGIDGRYVYLNNLYFHAERHPSDIPARALISGLRGISDEVRFIDLSTINFNGRAVHRFLLPNNFNLYDGAKPTYDNIYDGNHAIAATRAYIKSRVAMSSLSQMNRERIELSKYDPMWKSFWNSELKQPPTANYKKNILRILNSIPTYHRRTSARQYNKRKA